MENLIIGDVVQLASGGPKMTVSRIIGSDKNALLVANDTILRKKGYKDGDVHCEWFLNNKRESGVFKKEMVIKL